MVRWPGGCFADAYHWEDGIEAVARVNEKRFIKLLLEKLKGQGIGFKTVVADAQYDSARVRKTVRECGAEPVIPYRKCSRIKNALRVGRDFLVHGVNRLITLFKRRVCIEQASIQACLSFSAMLVVALIAVRQHKPSLMRSIKHYTTQ